MNKTVIITLLGPDRVGLVESIAAVITPLEGTWTDSRMAHLSGQFAGLLRVEISGDKVAELNIGLDKLRNNGIQVTLQEADNNNPVASQPRHLQIEILGQERPGIIRDITVELSRLKVNIEELSSEVQEASMSGELLFAATLQLSIPSDVSTESVQEALEAMSDQLMVDLNFER